MTPHSTLERLFNAITDRAINKTWIETLEPDGGAPWKELTEALEEAQTQLVVSMPHSTPVPSPDGAAEHAMQCGSCGETLHDGEICDDPRCPLGGSVSFASSDDVRSALADELRDNVAFSDKFNGIAKISVELLSRCEAVLRSAPVSAPARETLLWAAGVAAKGAKQCCEGDSGWHKGFRYAAENTALGIAADLERAADAFPASAVGVTREAIAWQSISDAPESIRLFAKGCETDPGRNSIIEYGGTIKDGRPFLLLRKDAIEKTFDRWLILPAVSAAPPVLDATASDDRALTLAERIRAQDLSVEDAAVEIMQYATDAAMQLHRDGYFSSPQDIGRETEALLANSREATVSARDAVIEECAKLADAYHPMLYAPEQDGRHPRDAAIKGTREEIAKAIRSLASGAKP